MSTGQSNAIRTAGAWLGILAGLCGIVVSLFWIANQVRMAFGTPLNIVLGLYSFYSRGFVFLAAGSLVSNLLLLRANEAQAQ